MSPPFNTLCLDRTLWDLFKDADGNIAMASPPYAVAQDAASAIRLVRGELYYDTAKGIPYFGQIFGESPPIQFLKNAFVSAALTVAGTVAAVCYLTSLANRQIVGQVQITDNEGNTLLATSAGGAGGGTPFILDDSTLGGPDVLT